MTLRSSLLALTILAGAANLADAQAPRKVDALVIRNTTSLTINYEVRFGAGSWKSFSLPPGQTMAHWAGVTSLLPPLVQVRFDADLSSLVIHQTYDVSTMLVADPFNGRRYAFGMSSGGGFLTLVNDELVLGTSRGP